jgi:hypothetical protein
MRASAASGQALTAPAAIATARQNICTFMILTPDQEGSEPPLALEA